MSKVKVEEDEVKAYYDVNQHLFTEPQKVSAKHITCGNRRRSKKS